MMGVYSISMRVELAVIVVLAVVDLSSQLSEEVTLPQGTVRGFRSRGSLSYLGIPFAKPPVGSLRFKAPQTHPGWQGTRDATAAGNPCIQIGGEGGDLSEDCLYINVWVPESLVDPAPVLVYIHGGAFLRGSSIEYGVAEGDILAANTSSVVVSMNYRLGVLGFLPINHLDYVGNAALLDQNLALKWVKDNIEYFMGDSNAVTLYGSSAGAASVFAHLLSPLSAGLFHRAVTYSGYSTGTIFTTEGLETSYILEGLAPLLNCSADNKTVIMECLQAVDAVELYRAALPLGSHYFVDGHFMPQQPGDIIKQGMFNKVPLLVSVCSDDGTVMVDLNLPSVIYQAGLTQQILDVFMAKVLELADKVPPSLRQAGLSLVKHEYTSDYSNDLDRLRSALNMARDSFFVSPSIAMADLYSEAGMDTYVDVFSQPTWGSHALSAIPIGATHSSDLSFLTGYYYKQPVTAAGISQEDVLKLSDQMMSILASFARGNPIEISTGSETVEWPKYSTADKQYLDIHMDIIPQSVKTDPYPRAVGFWNQVIPSLVPPTGETCGPAKRPSPIHYDPGVFGLDKEDTKILVIGTFVACGILLCIIAFLLCLFCLCTQHSQQKSDNLKV